MQNFKKKLKLIRPKKLIICKKILSTIFLISLCNSCCAAIIIDDFAENTLDKNLKIHPHKEVIIEDEFLPTSVTTKTLRKISNQLQSEVLPNIKTTNPQRKKLVISENEKEYILVRIKESFTTKSKPEEGSYLEFVTTEDKYIKGKLYPANTPIKARIETFSPRAMWGSPADIVISNFYINDIPLYGNISKTGKNNTLWVRPLACIAGVAFGTGFFFMFIKGGQAKINKNEVFKLYFE